VPPSTDCEYSFKQTIQKIKITRFFVWALPKQEATYNILNYCIGVI